MAKPFAELFFVEKGVSRGIVLHSKPYAEQGFAAVIAFVLRECVDKIDTLNSLILHKTVLEGIL
ncbi:MAG: hypothetical protein PUB00_05950 [Clostridiales bacterium]|nr:hypothetical protein [Clostridiales bacterium]